MTEKCLHCVEILNFKDKESFCHGILLIKGRVTGHYNGYIQLTVGGPLTQAPLETGTSSKGTFKFLLDLRQFEWCKDHEVSINAKFRIRGCDFDCCKQLCLFYTPSKSGYRLQPLYIKCAGEPPRSAENVNATCEKIDLNLRLVQCAYSEKIREAGFARHTFKLKAKCATFESLLEWKKALKSTENELWECFGKEILNSHWGSDPHLKFVAFISCTQYDGAGVAATADYSYENIRTHLRAHAALGGGGLALFGSAYFYAWPQRFTEIKSCFENDNKLNLTILPDDSNYRRTYGGVYATTLGSVCHELGHIFDLGHTDEGVMGTGFDYINHVFTVHERTENLPNRIINCQLRPTGIALNRLTLIKKQSNSFLEKYHEQRQNDSFYFTRSCCVILAHHKWLRESGEVLEAIDNEIYYEHNTGAVVSTNDPLKIIEIRSRKNSFVSHFYEFQKSHSEIPVLSFVLSPQIVVDVQASHYIFVLTCHGFTKALYTEM